jgi:dihydropteroate synthase
MGIVNVTPDSFSDGGRWTDPDLAAARARELEAAGADIVDLGAESTRPGADPISAEEEARRLFPVLERLRGTLAVPISVDTVKASVAEGALERGAEIVNDVSGGRLDPALWGVVARAGAGYVLMHSRGTPATMQTQTDYGDAGAAAEVAEALRDRFAAATAFGIAPQRIVLDPGIGFAKTPEQNVDLLAALDQIALAAPGRPVLVGLSRKSFLKRIAGEAALQVSTYAAETYAMLRGARIVRTHDVAAARAAAAFLEQVRRAENVHPRVHPGVHPDIR